MHVHRTTDGVRVSPTIFREAGFRFYFFSREEPRMHVHVQCADGEAKFWLEPSIEAAQNSGLSERKLRVAHCSSRHTSMKSAAHGNSTSGPEVKHITGQGLSVRVGREELLLAFEHFPWFRQAPVEKVRHVEQPSPEHLFWPDLDIDLSIESIRHPERFPLISR
jgi:hypothetical protein